MMGAPPGDIAGLLRWCSPVRDAADPERTGVVVGTGSSDGLHVCWTWTMLTEAVAPASVVLDLTDATGRVHAAWWLLGHDSNQWRAVVRDIAETDDAYAWIDWFVFNDCDEPTPEAVEILRRVVLAVAGRVAG